MTATVGSLYSGYGGLALEVAILIDHTITEADRLDRRHS